mmetsp:Transcript_68572/g.155105  ORF Transcript_68572/g.155105 Transcript_68572/m.155105 type:complete len:257 (+) Transcript_68572:561-1331(+)
MPQTVHAPSYLWEELQVEPQPCADSPPPKMTARRCFFTCSSLARSMASWGSPQRFTVRPISSKTVTTACTEVDPFRPPSPPSSPSSACASPPFAKPTAHQMMVWLSRLSSRGLSSTSTSLCRATDSLTSSSCLVCTALICASSDRSTARMSPISLACTSAAALARTSAPSSRPSCSLVTMSESAAGSCEACLIKVGRGGGGPSSSSKSAANALRWPLVLAGSGARFPSSTSHRAMAASIKFTFMVRSDLATAPSRT